MTRRRVMRPQRRLIFFGCEGDGERAYGALLNDIAQTRGMPLAIRAHPLNPGAGDPLMLVRRAVQRLADERRRGTLFQVAAVLLDEDRCAQDPDLCRQARDLARQNDLFPIWQQPDHEAFLLRHLDGCHALRPPAGTSLARLGQVWPEYRKPMTARELAARIDQTRVRQASTVEGGLNAFLAQIGWTYD